LNDKPAKLGGFASRQDSCTPSKIYGVAVGSGNANQQILATTSLRSIARIQLLPTATSSVFLVLDNDNRATTTNDGIALVASTTNTYIDLGLNTNFPYTGAVQGITSAGSTTVLVTQCNF